MSDSQVYPSNPQEPGTTNPVAQPSYPPVYPSNQQNPAALPNFPPNSVEQNPAAQNSTVQPNYPQNPVEQNVVQGIYASLPPQSVPKIVPDSGPVRLFIGNPNCCMAFCCPDTGGFCPCGFCAHCCEPKRNDCCGDCCTCLDPLFALCLDKLRFRIRDEQGAFVYSVWRESCTCGVKLHVRGGFGGMDFAAAERGLFDCSYTITNPLEATFARGCFWQAEYKVTGSSIDWDVSSHCCDGGFKVTGKNGVLIMNVTPACCNIIREACNLEHIQIDISDAANKDMCLAILAIVYG